MKKVGRTFINGLVALTVVSGSQRLRAADVTLVDAKAQYESAQYEQALQTLDALTTGQIATLQDQQSARLYRALCLIALDRGADAERSIEDMVLAAPTAPVPPDLPPRLAVMLQQVRPRVARAVVKQAYERGRDLYQKGQMAEATEQFKTAVTLLDDPAIGLASDASLADMRVVAEGFLRLATAAAAPPAAPPAAPQPRPTAPAPVPGTGPAPATAERAPQPVSSPAAGTARIPVGGPPTAQPGAGSSSPAAVAPAPQGGVSAPGFTLPVALVQPIPPFAPGSDSGYVTRGTGEIELTVAADGSVAAARMTVPIMPRYDTLLVNTAIAQWKYKPATRLGVAVPYTMRVRIVVQRR